MMTFYRSGIWTLYYSFMQINYLLKRPNLKQISGTQNLQTEMENICRIVHQYYVLDAPIKQWIDLVNTKDSTPKTNDKWISTTHKNSHFLH